MTVLVAAALSGVLVAPAQATAATNPANRLRSLPSVTRQVLIVHAPAYRTSYARLEAYTKVGRSWRRSIGPVTVRIGAAGFTDQKREGDRATPTGVYPFGATMYGITRNPGVRYPYHRLVAGDWWNGNSASAGYNQFVHGGNPGGASEALWRIRPQYSSLAVIGYNTPAVAGRGSAIFLHEASRGRPTLGCVSMQRAALVRVLRWLSPGASPRIVLSPDSALGRY